MAKRKNKSSTPRVKRMVRSQRLQSAKSWLPTYNGKSFVRGYKRHFGVDEVCALVELKMLGKNIDNSRIENARKSAGRKAEINAERRRAKQVEINPYPDSDEHYYYVAGYTSNGFAYGITWEEAEERGYLVEIDRI